MVYQVADYEMQGEKRLCGNTNDCRSSESLEPDFLLCRHASNSCKVADGDEKEEIAC